jgi:uncharacterized protein YodC (DUF2158 family)
MKRKFKTGDIVFLNSGSPELTVIEALGDEVLISWVSDDGTRFSCIIPSACVTPDEPKVA